MPLQIKYVKTLNTLQDVITNLQGRDIMNTHIDHLTGELRIVITSDEYITLTDDTSKLKNFADEFLLKKLEKK